MNNLGKLNIARFIVNHLSLHSNSSENSDKTTPIYFGGLITRIAVVKTGFSEEANAPRRRGGETRSDLGYYGILGWVRPVGNLKEYKKDLTEWLCTHDKITDVRPVFRLPNPDLTTFRPGQESYTYWPLMGEAQPRPPPRMPRPPPQDSETETEPTYTLQSIGQMMHRLELGQQEIRRDISSIDQRLGYLERNQSRSLYPMYNDYAQRGMIPPAHPHPEWFQYPQSGYTTPPAWGGFTDYSFGGMGGSCTDHFASGSGGFAGGSAGANGSGGGDVGDDDDDDEMDE